MRNLRIIRGEDMTISISTTLLEPYNSYEFRNLPKESFKGAATNFSRFPTGLDSEEELKELRLAILESVFKELDRIDHAIFLDFDNKNIQKREYHGEITYIKQSDLTINYRRKIIFLKKIRFIKHMSRSNYDTSIFEFRVDLREDLINKSIPEFRELRNFLEKRSVAFRGLFLTGNNPIPNRGTNRFITETVNKYFLCFFEKGVTSENRYSEAFEMIKVHKFELLLAVHVNKGDELNVDKPECF